MYTVDILDKHDFWMKLSEHERLAEAIDAVDHLHNLKHSTRIRDEQGELVKTKVKQTITPRANQLANEEFHSGPKWYVTSFNAEGALVRTDVVHNEKAAERKAYVLAYEFPKIELRNDKGELLKTYGEICESTSALQATSDVLTETQNTASVVDNSKDANVPGEKQG